MILILFRECLLNVRRLTSIGVKKFENSLKMKIVYRTANEKFIKGHRAAVVSQNLPKIPFYKLIFLYRPYIASNR